VSRRPPGRAPRLTVENQLLAEGHAVVAGLDEVGRGSLCGPVTVGVVVVDPGCGAPPRGLRDSKLLTASERTALVPRIRRWVVAFAVAHASSAEIDDYGIIAALRLAGQRALVALPQLPDCVLLDGNHDYLTTPVQLALDVPAPDLPVLALLPVVRTRVKADLTCASVAAASVLAKTTRDALMVGLAREHPDYGWEVNKGYATPQHRQALRQLGPTPYHRVSWRLGLEQDWDDGEGCWEPDPADPRAADIRPDLAHPAAGHLADWPDVAGRPAGPGAGAAVPATPAAGGRGAARVGAAAPEVREDGGGAVADTGPADREVHV
jgi:ribonuclease HII